MLPFYSQINYRAISNKFPCKHDFTQPRVSIKKKRGGEEEKFGNFLLKIETTSRVLLTNISSVKFLLVSINLQLVI